MRWLGLLGALLLLPSCYVITHDYDGGREITPGTVLTGPSELLGPIEGSTRATYLLWGLAELSEPSGAELAEELAVERYGADIRGVTELAIHEEMGVLDTLVSMLTLGIFTMQTIEVEGKVQGGGP